MVEKIKIYFYRFTNEKKYLKALDNKNEVERLKLEVRNVELESVIKGLDIELNTLRGSVKKFPIDINIRDPIPTKPSQRKEYVGEVAGFHTKILKPKLTQMIHTSHMLFEEENFHEQDNMLRGVIHAFREISRWGDSMVNEQFGNQVDNPSLPEEKILEEIIKQ